MPRDHRRRVCRYHTFDDAQVNSGTPSTAGYDTLSCFALVAGESSNLKRIICRDSTTQSFSNGSYTAYTMLVGNSNDPPIQTNNLSPRTGTRSLEDLTLNTFGFMKTQWVGGHGYYQYLMSFTQIVDSMPHSGIAAGPVYSY